MSAPTPSTTTPGAARLHAAFARAAQQNRAAFIPFMTAGYPDRKSVV